MRPPLRLLALALLLVQACRCGGDPEPVTCETTVCPQNGHCVEDERGPQCVCDDGWRKEGRVCHEIDECVTDADNACDPLATCRNTPGSYTCECPEEHVGDGLSCTPFGPWMWVQRAPGASSSSGLDLAVDEEGSTLLAGVLIGNVTFGETTLEAPADVGFIAKLDAEGTWRWARRIGETSLAMATSVAVDALGQVYVTGFFWGELTLGETTLVAGDGEGAYVAKLSPDGDWLWALQVESSGGVRGTALELDADGFPVVVGSFRGSVQLGATTLTAAGFGDLFLARLSPEGAFDWVDQLSATEEVTGSDLAFTPDGATVLVGDFSGTLTAGPHTLVPSGFTDAFVARRDADGTWAWASRAGSTSTVMGRGVVVDATGAPVIIGTFHDTAQFGALEQKGLGEAELFVAGLQPDGTWDWVTRAGGTKADFGMGIALEGETLSVVGEFARSANFGGTRLESRGLQDLFVGQLDLTGTWLWAARAGGASADTGMAIATGPDGGLHVTGSFMERALFMPHQLQASGAQEFFVGRAERSVLP